MQEIRVGLWGFGAMGSGIAKMIASKKGIVITGVCDKWDKIVGKDMYELLDLERGNRPEVKITADENEVFYPGSCDLAVLATDSFVKAQMDKLVHCIECGINVISTAEEMAWPQAQFPAEAKELDVLAKKHGVTVLGTGINPGFVLDYLILALTGTCEQVLSMRQLVSMTWHLSASPSCMSRALVSLWPSLSAAWQLMIWPDTSVSPSPSA